MENNDAANPAVTRDKLVADLKAVYKDAEELVLAARAQMGDKTSDARTKLEASLKELKNRIAVTEAVIVDRTKEYAEKTDTYVRDNPWKSAGIAAGFGFLLGMLCRR